MTWLEVADLVFIASRILELDTDQVLDLLDPTAAEAALAQRPRGDLRDEGGTDATMAAAC